MKIIICGSMSASKEMLEAEEKLKALKHEVVLPDFTHEYAGMDTLEKMYSESMHNKIGHDLILEHYKKIKDGDAILLINVERKNTTGYIGGNSFLEIGFAHILGKSIYLLHEIPKVGYRDEIEAMKPILLNGDLSKIV